jgi:hypothetical protein
LTLFPPLPAGCSDDDWWNSRQAGLKAVEVLLTMMGNDQLTAVRLSLLPARFDPPGVKL